MPRSIEIDCIHTSSLNIGIKYEASLIIIGKANDVADKFFGFDARKWGVEISGVTNVN